MALMIDPPSGWMYGFPKSIPKDVTDHLKWLVENGYPQEEIDKFDDPVHALESVREQLNEMLTDRGLQFPE